MQQNSQNTNTQLSQQLPTATASTTAPTFTLSFQDQDLPDLLHTDPQCQVQLKKNLEWFQAYLHYLKTQMHHKLIYLKDKYKLDIQKVIRKKAFNVFHRQFYKFFFVMRFFQRIKSIYQDTNNIIDHMTYQKIFSQFPIFLKYNLIYCKRVIDLTLVKQGRLPMPSGYKCWVQLEKSVSRTFQLLEYIFENNDLSIRQYLINFNSWVPGDDGQETMDEEQSETSNEDEN